MTQQQTSEFENTVRMNEITITKILVAINIVVFLVLEVLGDTTDGQFLYEHGGMWTMDILEGKGYYRLLTSCFLHAGIGHLFSNMVSLYFLGDVLEKGIGKFRFSIVYLGAGILGNLVSMAWEIHTNAFAVGVGASGAIFGIMGGLIFEVIRNKGQYYYVTIRRLLFYVILCLYTGFTSSGIDNFAHIGGLIAGFLLTAVIDFRRRKPLRKQVDGYDATGN